MRFDKCYTRLGRCLSHILHWFEPNNLSDTFHCIIFLGFKRILDQTLLLNNPKKIQTVCGDLTVRRTVFRPDGGHNNRRHAKDKADLCNLKNRLSSISGEATRWQQHVARLLGGRRDCCTTQINDITREENRFRKIVCVTSEKQQPSVSQWETNHHVLSSPHVWRGRHLPGS